ncbi:hypothetical protein D6774_01325 [Candidatus Woesearchaeota archaeon]|nr:MAG: hypothetical protein D6774_01325 [Candidatus Woesearchaeota archaeon]
MTLAKILQLIFFLCLCVSVAAQTDSIHLLAVSEDKGTFTGTTAKLFLEIKPGQGRVFIETIPAAKVDTQLSTRFAQQSACKFTNTDCSKYDFFYQIQSSSSLIGGPSGGAAIAGLTAAMLRGDDVRDDVAITGTISSGYLIGPVGHVLEKVEAAAQKNLSLVLIPAGQAEYHDEKNRTFDVITVGRLKGVEVREVENLAQVVSLITGKKIEEKPQEIVLPPFYEKTMREVAQELCDHSTEKLSLLETDELGEDEQAFVERGKEILLESENLTDQYYAKASRCFSANVQFQKAIDLLKNESSVEMLNESISLFESELDAYVIETLSDLQTMMIVRERLRDAKEHLTSDPSYAKVRFESAQSWARFFGMPSREYKLDKEALAASCFAKRGEVEELRQYLLLFVEQLGGTQTRLEVIDELAQQGDYASCLYEAALLHADLQAIASTLGVSSEEFEQLVDRKLNAAKTSVAQQIDQGIFPMAAYAYYELGRSVQESSPANALIYAEYALELSELDLYFEREPARSVVNLNFVPMVLFFLAGLIFGIVIGMSMRKRRPRKLRLR